MIGIDSTEGAVLVINILRLAPENARMRLLYANLNMVVGGAPESKGKQREVILVG